MSAEELATIYHFPSIEVKAPGVAHVEATFAISVGNAGTAREVGLFTRSDLLMARATFSGVFLATDDALNIKWTITFTDGT